MSSLVIIIPSLVQSVDPNMILMSILENTNNYELLIWVLSSLSDRLQHLAIKYLAISSGDPKCIKHHCGNSPFFVLVDLKGLHRLDT